MNFVELRFLFFFVLVYAVYWALRGNTSRKVWLLATSYVFYGAWDWRFVTLIMASTAVDYVAGIVIDRAQVPRTRRIWMIVSLVANLGLLGFFKYFGFFVDSAVGLAAWFGFALDKPTLEIILPVGISFYTFQTLSYTIDVYRRELPATRSLLDFAFFVAFFPQLVAGPIVRACDFLPQLTAKKRFLDIDLRPALALFLIGYVKKACVADNIAALIDPVFANPATYESLELWLGVALYSIQIYCDFSGYSDMAIATAAMLGYRLVLNFDAPFLSVSIREFWRRWHISLSTWFRDYLFVPLGGNRKGPVRTGFNLFVVFFLCGLWHGADWNYVLFGLYHGAFLVFERFVPVERLPRPLGHGYAWIVFMFGWPIFRCTEMGTTGDYLGGLLGSVDPAGAGVLAMAWWILPTVFMAIQWTRVRLGADESWAARIPDPAYAAMFGAACALILPWAAKEYTPFVYFQF